MEDPSTAAPKIELNQDNDQSDSNKMIDNITNKNCSCQTKESGIIKNQFIFSIGKLSCRFPSVGIEHEFQQRERSMLLDDKKIPELQNERIAVVLRNNQHLARSVCFIQSVSGIPAYVIVPATSQVLDNLLTVLEKSTSDDHWVIIIGKRGEMAPPTACNGVLAPYVYCDVVYAFSLNDLANNLVKSLTNLFNKKKWPKDKFIRTSQDVFRLIINAPENLGSNDTHRALNYVLAQHPGPYIAAMEFSEKSLLHNLETIVSEGPAGQKLVTIIMTFIDRTTGVPERVSTIVDVTEEWPFIAESHITDTAPIGMSSYVELK